MRRLLIDLSSILRASHYVGKDYEFGKNVSFEGKSVWVNSAQWAVDTFMASYTNVLQTHDLTPFQTVLVKDGVNSRRLRADIYPNYKANRPPSPPELNAEYAEAADEVCREVMNCGGLVVWQDEREADDVIAYLAQELEGPKLIWSRDADMLALMEVGEVDVLLKDTLNPTIHEHCPAEFVHVYKALVGDSSDNLPGAKGFGDGAFTQLCKIFQTEGLRLMRELIEGYRLPELQDDVAELKSLQKVIDSAGLVYLSYACAKFYPEKINTPRQPLEVAGAIPRADQPVHHRLSPWAWKKLAPSATDPRAKEWLVAELRRSPLVALDIETSTSSESEAWVENVLASKKSRRKDTVFVDVYGSKLTGLSLTFGKNMQHTVYLPVRHLEVPGGPQNWSSEQVADVISGIPETTSIIIHNTAFELPVLYREWGGWVDNAQDTLVMKSYVDENTSLGLKFCSEHYFGYKQKTYEETTTIEGVAGTLKGGKVKDTWVDEQTGVQWERRQYKMDELPAGLVFDYACDDTICTAMLYNRLRFTMELEKTWDAYQTMEQPAFYWVAEAFVDGIDIDWEYLEQLRAEDAATYAAARKVVLDYLATVDWPGTKYQPFQMNPKGIKSAFQLVTGGQELVTRFRKLDKLIEEVAAQGAPELAALLIGGDTTKLDEYLSGFFDAAPEFDSNKDAHLRTLMYEVMKLPIRFRTRVTALQREKGKREGTPQVDDCAIDHAIKLDLQEGCEELDVLLAVRTMKRCKTREQLYYNAYPVLRHWESGKIHPQLGQCRTATRRFAPNNPNINQLPKKNEGKKVRKLISTSGLRDGSGLAWYVVAMDFSGQELRLAAEDSGDEALTSCYVGENLRDPHSLTGHGIAQKQLGYGGSYEDFQVAKEEDKELKACRAKGKGVNFSSQYLCRAPKLAKLLVVSEEEAQLFLDAKNEVYWGLAQWQQERIEKAHQRGYADTFLGAKRHLHDKLTSADKWVVAEAERQAVNFRIQGSGAEMTKLAINEMWLRGIFDEPGVKLLFPVHDEVVVFVREDRLLDAIPAIHACMVQRYASMKIPLESEISIGYNFGELITVGKEPTESAITAAIAKLKTGD